MPPKSGTKFHKNSKAPKCPSATSLPHVKATYLVIVESPSKITKIKSYLGPEYDVIATCGHLCTLDKLPWKDIQYHQRFGGSSADNARKASSKDEPTKSIDDRRSSTDFASTELTLSILK